MEAGPGNHERLVECGRRPDAVLGHRGREKQGTWRLSHPLHCIPGDPSPHGPGPASLLKGLGMTGGKKYHTAWEATQGWLHHLWRPVQMYGAPCSKTGGKVLLKILK